MAVNILAKYNEGTQNGHLIIDSKIKNKNNTTVTAFLKPIYLKQCILQTSFKQVAFYQKLYFHLQALNFKL